MSVSVLWTRNGKPSRGVSGGCHQHWHVCWLWENLRQFGFSFRLLQSVSKDSCSPKTSNTGSHVACLFASVEHKRKILRTFSYTKSIIKVICMTHELYSYDRFVLETDWNLRVFPSALALKRFFNFSNFLFHKEINFAGSIYRINCIKLTWLCVKRSRDWVTGLTSRSIPLHTIYCCHPEMPEPKW